MRTFAWLSLVLVLRASTAFGADGPQEWVNQGLEFRAARKDAEALALFNRAYSVEPTPSTLAQVALAEQALGRWVEAEEHLAAAMAFANDKWIKSHQQPLAKAQDAIKRHLGSLEVSCNVPNADLFVDGIRILALPQRSPARVPTGLHVVELRAPGYVSATRSIDIESGAAVREHFDLVVTPVVVEPVLAAPPTTKPASLPATRLVASAPGESHSNDGQIQRTLGWSALGLGIAAGTMSGVAFVLRGKAVDDYNADRSCPGLDASAQPPSCADRISGVDSWRTVGVVSAVTAVVLMVGGVVGLVTAPRQKESRSARSPIRWMGRSVQF